MKQIKAVETKGGKGLRVWKPEIRDKKPIQLTWEEIVSYIKLSSWLRKNALDKPEIIH